MKKMCNINIYIKINLKIGNNSLENSQEKLINKLFMCVSVNFFYTLCRCWRLRVSSCPLEHHQVYIYEMREMEIEEQLKQQQQSKTRKRKMIF